MSTEDFNYGGAEAGWPKLDPASDGLHAYDLSGGFGNASLTDAGECMLVAYPKDPVYLELGRDIVEITQVADPSLPEDTLYMSKVGAGDRTYRIRNLSAASPEEATVMFVDGAMQADEAGRFDPREQPSLVIGRGDDATPGLQLSELTSRRHVSVRPAGVLQGLVIMDLNSTNGTTVFANPREVIGDHPQVLVPLPGETVPYPKTWVNQRWYRQEQ